MNSRPPLATTAIALAMAGALIAGTSLAAESADGPMIQLTTAATPYTVAGTCDLTRPLAAVYVWVSNAGNAPSVERYIGASDDTGALAGGQKLMPLAPGQKVGLTIGLNHVASSVVALGGPHVITLSLGPQTLAKVPVTVPQALCAGVVPPPPAAQAQASGVGMHRARVPSPTPSPGPLVEQKVDAVRSNAAIAAALATPASKRPLDAAAVKLGLPIPTDLHYTTNVGTCQTHGGDADFCRSLLGGRGLVIYWSASDATCVSCHVTGFRLRTPPVTAGAPPGPVLDTTKDRVAFETMPASGWAGSCFVVSSYSEPVQKLVNLAGGGNIVIPGSTPVGTHAESPPSKKLCIGGTRLTVAVAPTAIRSFRRSYWFSLLVDHGDHVTHIDDFPPSTGMPFDLGLEVIHREKGNQTHHINTFHRTVVAFEPNSLGSNTIYGGSFVYEAVGPPGSKDCALLEMPAPSGWENAKWITPPDGYKWFDRSTTSGTEVVVAIDAELRGWRAGVRKTFVLDARRDAEKIRDGELLRGEACSQGADKVRLLVSTGIDV